MELKLEDIVNHLQGIKQEQGEDAYHLALKRFVTQVLASDTDVSGYLRQVLDALGATMDLDPLRKEAEELKKQRSAAQEQAKTAGSGRDMNQVMIDARSVVWP